MRQEVYVLPVRCSSCGVVFDLWPVLHEQEKKHETVFAEENEMTKLLNQSLCWRCKQTVLNKLKEQEELEDFDEESDDESDDDKEYEMMLDFE